MKLRTCMLFICIVALPFLALAQGSVDGKWAGEVPGDADRRWCHSR